MLSYTNCAPSFQSINDLSSIVDGQATPPDGTEPVDPLKPSTDGLDTTPVIVDLPPMASDLEKLTRNYRCGEVTVADKLVLFNRNLGPLTSEQYQNSVNAIFGTKIYNFPLPHFYGDESHNTTLGLENPGSTLVQGYFASAQMLLDKINSEAGLKNKFLSCGEAIDSCLTKLYNDTGKLLFKRPMTNAEKIKISSKAKAFSQNKSEQLEAAVYLLLTSPQFNYHSYAVDKPVDDTKMQLLNEYDLAQRLSFFIWGRVPDNNLLNLAAQNKLKSSLQEVVTSMLQDARSVYLARSLAFNWFSMGNFKYNNIKKYEYSGLNQSSVNWSLSEQVTAYVNDLIKNNRPVTELFKSDFQYHTANTAKLYKLQLNGVGTGFSKQPADTPYAQAGILSHMGVLSENSSSSEIQVHQRGNYILKRALCDQPIGTPSGNTFNEGDNTIATTSGRVNHLSEKAQCSACHKRMDPYGKGLERFNSLGLYREKYSNGEVINYSQEIGNSTISSPSDLGRFIATERKDIVNYCTTKNVLSLVTGKNFFNDGELGEANAVGSCLSLDMYSRFFEGQNTDNLKFQDLILKIIGDGSDLFGQTSKLGR